MSNDIVMELRGLSKRIGGKTIVDNLTFDVPRGEVFGFLGPNGAGKTTTIRMIMGLMSMSAGSVKVNGIDVASRFEEAMTHMGGIVENPEMYKFLTGYQNLKHFSRMHPGITKARIDEVIELVGLQNRIHDKVKKYSLGMRQRLGVAQAILHKPSLLILDEPTNGLDPAGIRELRDYLRTLTREEGISVLVSSHLLSEMELMCDRVAIIQNGKLVDVKRMEEMKQDRGFGIMVFEVDKPREAKNALDRLFPGVDCTVTELGLELFLERERIPDAAACLVGEGIKLYGIKPVVVTLEDTFLEMTGSGQIA